MTDLSIEIKGLEETQREMARMVEQLHGKPMLEGMRDATLLVQRDSRKYAPVDTGRLRASIVPEVRAHGDEVVGVVGSNVVYAPYQELGTKPHFVPAKYIGVWASRHGFGFTGLPVSGKAKRFLERAFNQNKDRIARLIGNVVGKIVKG